MHKQAEDTTDPDSEQGQLLKKMLSFVEYTYVSGEATKDEKEAELVYKIKSKGFMDVMPHLISNTDEKPNLDDINWDEIGYTEKEVTFKMIKEGDKWLVNNMQEVILGIVGMDRSWYNPE